MILREKEPYWEKDVDRERSLIGGKEINMEGDWCNPEMEGGRLTDT